MNESILHPLVAAALARWGMKHLAIACDPQ